MNNLTVWDALIAWRDDLLKKDVLRKSKIDYLSNMEKLIERDILDLEQPLSEFRKIQLSKLINFIDNAIDWSPSTKKARRTLLLSFYRFSQQQNIKKTAIEIPFDECRSLKMLAISELLSSNEDKAKSQYLTDKEINRFLIELRNINFRDFLICRTMWELKCTIHHVLNFKVRDYDPIKGVFWINQFEGRFGNLRQDIKEPILKLCENKKNTDLIFSTDKGNRIHPGQIVRNMKVASKRAKSPVIISPKIIYALAKAFYERAFAAIPSFAAIPEDELKKISEELSIQHEELMKN